VNSLLNDLLDSRAPAFEAAPIDHGRDEGLGPVDRIQALKQSDDEQLLLHLSEKEVDSLLNSVLREEKLASELFSTMQ
jgi:hypothetical protein